MDYPRYPIIIGIINIIGLSGTSISISKECIILGGILEKGIEVIGYNILVLGIGITIIYDDPRLLKLVY